jgi:periodic tryptophan protein 2
LAVDCAGEIVAAGTLDSHEIYLWSLQTGQLVDVFSGHSAPITSLAFEPTRGRILASGSWDRLVRLWDIYAAPDAKSYGDPFTHESDVLALSFRPDGVELTVATLAGHLITWSVEGGIILSTIDGRLDISSKSLTGAAFHTICHSADGSCLLAAGSFSALALYHLATRTLLKQFPIPIGPIDNSFSSGKGLLAPKIDSLAPVARSILFSPTGRSWSLLTPEGILIYSLDASLLFDPFDLTPDLSAESVRSALHDGKYLHALVMALRLNIFSVQRAVFDSIPPITHVISLVIAQLPPKYLPGLLDMIASLCDPLLAYPKTPFPLQKLFIFLDELLSHHSLLIKAQRSALTPSLRVIQKAVLSHYKDFSLLVNDNSFEIYRILLHFLH